MPRRQQQYEEVAGQRLPLGGINGYRGVRGKQGKKKNKFQGVTPKKQHRTLHYITLHYITSVCGSRVELCAGTSPRTVHGEGPVWYRSRSADVACNVM